MDHLDLAEIGIAAGLDGEPHPQTLTQARGANGFCELSQTSKLCGTVALAWTPIHMLAMLLTAAGNDG